MATYTKQPSSKDNWMGVHETERNVNKGSLTQVQVDEWATTVQRSILEFDVSDFPGGTIISATLYLYYFDYETYGGIWHNPAGKTVWTYKLTKTGWIELEATWVIYKTGSNWDAEGGDYVTSDPSGDSDVIPADPPAWMSWTITDIVQDAITNHAGMVELLVKMASETGGTYRPWFYSHNYTDNLTLRPKLVIEYTPVYEMEITEGIAVGEVVIKNPILVYAEGVAMAEVLQKVITKAPFIEGIALGEVVESVRVKFREFIEGLAIGEVLLKQTHKVVSEGVALGEVITKQISRVYSEGVSVGEVVIKMPIKVFSEGLAIGEVVVRFIGRVITEGIAIGEVLIKMRVIRAVRSLSPLRVLDAIRNLLKERQL